MPHDGARHRSSWNNDWILRFLTDLRGGLTSRTSRTVSKQYFLLSPSKRDRYTPSVSTLPFCLDRTGRPSHHSPASAKKAIKASDEAPNAPDVDVDVTHDDKVHGV